MRIISTFSIIVLFIMVMLVSFMISLYNVIGYLFVFFSFMIVYRESMKLFRMVEGDEYVCSA